MSQDNFTEIETIEDICCIDSDMERFAFEKRWANIRIGAIVLFIVGVILLPVLTGGHLIPISSLAWLNCAVFVFFMIYFIRKRTLGSLIPIITTSTMITGSCFGIVYFAIFYPNASYPTKVEWISFFSGGVRYQLVILLFQFTYFITLTFLLNPERRVVQSPAHCSVYIAYATTLIYIPALVISVLVKFFPVPGIIKWFGDGMLLYCNGFMFVTGCLFQILSKKFKIMVFLVLVSMLVIFTIASSRGKAIYPIAFLLMGYILFSDAKPKTKIAILAVSMMALPIYTVIGNTVRVLLGTVGFEDFSTRLATMKEWRYAIEKSGDPLMQMFGRFFFTGGNSVIESTPSQHPYMTFYPGKFLLETLESLLPRALIYRPYYQGTMILTEYGLLITEETSIEVSIIGGLWMLGGYVPVIMGGFAVALIHGFVAWRIRAAWLQNPDKGMFYFVVMVQSFLENFNLDIIGSFRQMIWHLVFAFVVFKLITPLLKIWYHQAQPKESTEQAI